MIKPQRPQSLTLQRVGAEPGTPSFASIALKIGDPRLETALRELSEHWIKREVNNARFVPRRSEVRAVVSKLKNKTRGFEIALNRVSGRLLLELPATADTSFLAAREAIQAIYLLCEDTLSIIPTKGGAPKKPGAVTCAMIVIEAWASVRGGTPGHNNETAQEVCADYWRASGGNQGDGVYAWSRHIATASRSRSKWRRIFRDEIARSAKGTE
jgi:hypothetical protein